MKENIKIQILVLFCFFANLLNSDKIRIKTIELSKKWKIKDSL